MTLTLTQLSVYLKKNKRTLHRMIKDKRFPIDPIKGTNPRLWSIKAVDEWLANGGSINE